MTKIKLVTGEIIACESVEIIGSVLHFTIKDKMTSEELAVLFKDKEKTSNIIFLTESGKVSGNREGFTSYAGQNIDENGVITVLLIQPRDVTEARISSAEGTAHQASAKADAVQEETQASIEQVVTEMTLAMASMLPAEAPAETVPEEEVSANV